MSVNTTLIILLQICSTISAFIAPRRSIIYDLNTSGCQLNTKGNDPNVSLDRWKLRSSPRATTRLCFSDDSESDNNGVNEIRSLVKLWTEALASGDENLVADRYAQNAILLFTENNEAPLQNHLTIKHYYQEFLKLRPKGNIIESSIRISDDGNMAQDAGIYEFELGDSRDVVQARYNFIYRKDLETNEWKIVNHHSSLMPQKECARKDNINQVRNLFYLWNDALATQDPDAAARRYAKNAVFLPSFTDTPLIDNESIREYYKTFMKFTPNAKVLEGNIMIGDDWCMDTGVYEITIGDATSKKNVKAMYSFLYIYEENQWKIARHSSCVIDEHHKRHGMYYDQRNNRRKKIPMVAKREVKYLMNLWVKAIETFDAQLVVNRYAQNAIYIDPLIDEPLKTTSSIKAYFDTALAEKPKVQILESHVTIGEGWFEDTGVYEFTMQDNWYKVKARYSFTYVLENNEWKILHHYSSIIPESTLELWNETDGGGEDHGCASEVIAENVSVEDKEIHAVIKDYLSRHRSTNNLDGDTQLNDASDTRTLNTSPNNHNNPSAGGGDFGSFTELYSTKKLNENNASPAARDTSGTNQNKHYYHQQEEEDQKFNTNYWDYLSSLSSSLSSSSSDSPSDKGGTASKSDGSVSSINNDMYGSKDNSDDQTVLKSDVSPSSSQDDFHRSTESDSKADEVSHFPLEDIDCMTVAKLKAALESLGVCKKSFRGLRKAELRELLIAKNTQDPTVIVTTAKDDKCNDKEKTTKERIEVQHEGGAVFQNSRDFLEPPYPLDGNLYEPDNTGKYMVYRKVRVQPSDQNIKE